MSEIHFTPGATPAARLNFVEFLREKIRKAEANHTNLRIKLEDAHKDLENLEKQVTLSQGFIDYLGRYLKEWQLYSKDTVELRQLEAVTMAERDKNKEDLKKKAEKRSNKKNR